jgi:hypothetical protein
VEVRGALPISVEVVAEDDGWTEGKSLDLGIAQKNIKNLFEPNCASRSAIQYGSRHKIYID